ncbi:MAG: PT domain-containing protein [Aristaeellaceae bacterium]
MTSITVESGTRLDDIDYLEEVPYWGWNFDIVGKYWSLKGALDYGNDMEGTLEWVNPETELKAPGTYPCEIQYVPSKPDYFESNTFTVDVIVRGGDVDKPTLSLPYNGKAQTAVAPADAPYEVVSSDSATEPGTYSAYVQLKEPDIYSWYDGFAAGAARPVDFIITKADLTLEGLSTATVDPLSYGEILRTGTSDDTDANTANMMISGVRVINPVTGEEVNGQWEWVDYSEGYFLAGSPLYASARNQDQDLGDGYLIPATFKIPDAMKTYFNEPSHDFLVEVTRATPLDSGLIKLTDVVYQPSGSAYNKLGDYPVPEILQYALPTNSITGKTIPGHLDHWENGSRLPEETNTFNAWFVPDTQTYDGPLNEYTGMVVQNYNECNLGVEVTVSNELTRTFKTKDGSKLIYHGSAHSWQGSQPFTDIFNEPDNAARFYVKMGYRVKNITITVDRTGAEVLNINYYYNALGEPRYQSGTTPSGMAFSFSKYTLENETDPDWAENFILNFDSSVDAPWNHDFCTVTLTVEAIASTASASTMSLRSLSAALPATAVPTAEPTEAPTTEPTVEPTEAPTAEPTVEPTEAPTVEPTEEPVVEPTPIPVPGAISSSVKIEPEQASEKADGVWQIQLEQDQRKVKFNWKTSETATEYLVYTLRQDVEVEPEDEENEVEPELIARTTDKSIELNAAKYAEGRYSLYVGAVLEDGSVSWGEAQFELMAYVAPTEEPTAEPTEAPTEAPTAAPTEAPTEAPTAAPTEAPTEAPTAAPTEAPTEAPTAAPTEAPTEAPTAAPTEAPTEAPTAAPTEAPTEAPTAAPTEAPTEAPTVEPTPEPVSEPAPEADPEPDQDAPAADDAV